MQAQGKHKVLMRDRPRSSSEEEDVRADTESKRNKRLMALKIEKGAISPEIQMTSKTYRWERNELF